MLHPHGGRVNEVDCDTTRNVVVSQSVATVRTGALNTCTNSATGNHTSTRLLMGEGGTG